MSTLLGILGEAWHIFMESSFYILFGLALSGLIRIFIAPEKIVKYLGRGKIRSVLYASLFGIPIPFCSCGVVPTAVSLKKQGASTGAAVAFLISTPQTGPDSLALTYALLGPIMTIVRPVAALLTAICAGILENFFGKAHAPSPVAHPHEAAKTCCAQQPHSWKHKCAEGMQYAFVDVLNDISLWLLIGMIIGGAILFLVPSEWMGHYLGGGLWAMLVMLVASVPLYVCAAASTPIAAALILKGVSPGAALVFLLAGPATNASSFTVIAKVFGKRTTALYLASIAVCSVVLGLMLDKIYSSLEIQVKVLTGDATEIFSPEANKLFALFLILLMLHGWWRRRKLH